jgi:phosphoglycolate phosphatase-like HAD superfamily hydrolase/predicted amidophosphoribosyltransferase
MANHQHKFELVLFDVDETLLDSAMLKSYRETGDREGLNHALDGGGGTPYPGVKDTLIELQEMGIQLGYVTASPRWYASILLKKYLPEIKWITSVTYEDVERQKPYPDGIKKALESLRSPILPTRTLYIGDTPEDVEAGLHHGVATGLALWKHDMSDDSWPRLSYKSPSDSQKDIVEGFAKGPDYVLEAPEIILDIIRKPLDGLPFLESVAAMNGEAQLTKVPEKKNVLRFAKPNNEVVGIALSRYFAQESVSHIHDRHNFSKLMLSAKDNGFQKSWIEAIAIYISRLIDFYKIDVVTVIPAKQGGLSRMERLADSVSQLLRSTSQTTFDPQQFTWVHGAQSNKVLTAQDRLLNVREHMQHHHKAIDVRGKRVLVIDDIVTTGATFLRAKEILKSYGAKEVLPLALATTCGYRFVPIEIKECPWCGGEMIIRTRKKDGKRFWGCKNWRKNGCTYTEDCHD